MTNKTETVETRANRSANAVVFRYTAVQLRKAIAAAESEIRGQGCGCNTCKHIASRANNSWIDFATEGETTIYDREKTVVEVNNHGKLVLRRVG